MNERQTKIVELLSKKEKIEVKDLSTYFNVSQVTIRKDLVVLENQGLIKREHGYATLNESDDLTERLAYHYKDKQKIAKKAAQMIHPGETVMIESGSCCALLALEIAKTIKDATIITNSAFIAEYIRHEEVNTILLGGQYQSESQANVGPLVRQCVKQFFVDKLFIGTDGVHQKAGYTGADYLRSEAVKDMAAQADQVIVVTESEKFGRISTVNILGMNEVKAVVTDNHISQEYKDFYQENNIDLIIAE